MFLKYTNQNRFAQTAGIGVGRAFAPCAEDIASAHPRRCTCDGRGDRGGRLHSARDLAKDDSASSWNRIGVWSTEKDGLGLL